jgi:hypothetical protein
MSRAATSDEMQVLVEAWNGRFADMEGAINAIAAAVHALQVDASQGGSDDEPRTMRDTFWKCEKCSAKLAVYDAKQDEMRIRHKDFMCYIVPGDGGKVTILCRTCGHLNVASGSRKH